MMNQGTLVFLLSIQNSYLVILNFFIYLLIWAVLGLCCFSGFSLVAVSRGFCVVSVPGLLFAMASLAVEHRL